MEKDLKEGLVDIICPVYNKASVIDVFIKSFLFKLSSKEFNLLIIDDGSTDNLKEVVEKYKSDNIYYFHKENGGVSSARNEGLKLSKSKYIWFCDPDDEIITNGQSLLTVLEKYNGDVFVFSFVESYNQSAKVEIANKYDNECYSFKDFLINYDYFGENNRISTLWNKIYRREITSGTFFDEGLNNAEDRLFNLNILFKEGTCVVNKLSIYNHIIYKTGTLSTTRSLKKIKDVEYVNNINLRRLKTITNYGRKELKKNINIICIENLCNSDRSVNNIYINKHKEHDINVFPMLSIHELLFICPFNYYIFRSLKMLRAFIKR